MLAFAQEHQPDNVIVMPVKNHITFSSGSNEWYTSSIYADAAREVMNGIDLDPASCKEANLVIRANHYYTQEQNGLLHDWHGSIWLNPPYGTTNGKSNQGIWARRLIQEYQSGNVTQAIFLCNALTDTRWFNQLWEYPICFTAGRVNFYTSKTTTTVGNTHGSAFVYLGPHEQKFIEVFSKFGRIAKAIDTPKAHPINLSLWEPLC